MVRENGCRGAHSAAVGGSAAYGCGVPLAGTVRPPSPHTAVAAKTGTLTANPTLPVAQSDAIHTLKTPIFCAKIAFFTGFFRF